MSKPKSPAERLRFEPYSYGHARLPIPSQQSGSTVPSTERIPLDVEGENVVLITDAESGVTYVVAVEDRDGRAILLWQWTRPHGNQSMSEVYLIPSAILATRALGYVARRRAEQASLAPELRGFVDHAEVVDGLRHERPPLEEVATQVRHKHPSDSDAAHFGAVYGVSPATVERWVQAARNAGLLPERTGRPGRPRTRARKPE